MSFRWTLPDNYSDTALGVMSMQTDHDHEAQISHEVRRAVTAGRKIEAVKLLREQTGMGLFDAKEIVDDLERTSVSFSAQHPAAPRNDTGAVRMLLVFLALAVVVGTYIWLQE